MGKRDDLEKHINKKSKKDERKAGHKRNEAYCPQCQKWYKFGDKKHANH